MKYLYILGAFIALQGCYSPDRAGSLYNPDIVRNFSTNQKVPVTEDGEAVYEFHSALGNYCIQYYHNHELQMVCDNGDDKKMVPILQ